MSAGFLGAIHPHARRNFLLFGAIVAAFVFGHAYFAIFGEEGVLQKGIFGWGNVAFAGGLGLLSTFCLNRTRLPGLWDPEISVRIKFLIPFAIGLGLSVVSIFLDVMTNASEIIARELGVANFQAPFPASLNLYLVGAVFITVTYYYLIINPVMWLVGRGLFKGRFDTWVFWITALPLGLYEPIIQGRFDAVEKFGAWGYVQMVMGFPLPLVQLWFLRKGGLISSTSARLGHYMVWHILYGAWTLYGRG